MKKLFVLLFPFVLCFSANSQSSVLFIGNSYTYANDLPLMFQSLSGSLNKTITAGSKTNGGFTFQNQWNDPATFNAIHQQEWDLVIVQGQSQEPSFPVTQVNSATLPFAEAIADSVYASSNCTNLMYYMTWGRENGDPQWDSINTFDKMNERLVNAYMRFADSTDAMVSPVAVAWKYVRDHNPAIQLYSGDGSHPSVAGTYLIACTFFAAVFQETPVGANYLAGLDQATAAILQNAAATTVLNDLDLYGLHSIDYRTVAGINWNLDGNGLLALNSTSIHDEDLHWSVDGMIYTTENFTHQLTTPGTYLITLIASSECNSDTAYAVVNYNTAGFEEQNLQTVLIYPNPSTGEIHISGNQDNLLKVYDLNGRFVKEKEFMGAKADLTELTNGFYLLEVDGKFFRLNIRK